MIPLLQNHPFCRLFDQVKQQATEALQTLQNRHDLNSNVVLFCYWFAANNQGLLSKSQVKHLLTEIYSWHQKIVLPLTTLSQQLTKPAALDLWTPDDPVYESTAKTLGVAEQVEQFLLAETFPKKPRRGRSSLAQLSTHAHLNISTYCQISYISLDEADYQCLAQISTAVFPEMDATKTISLIRTTLSERQSKKPVQTNLLIP